MLKYEVKQMADGFHAAGYWRPGRHEFVPMVTGCPSEAVAYQECLRLTKEEEARSAPPTLPHHMRKPSSGWYQDE